MKLVVGISGASGAIYGLDLLKKLKEHGVETHVIISQFAKKNLAIEHDLGTKALDKYSDFTYSNSDLAASIASGSFLHDGMFIVPASMKTVSSIASGYSDNLITRVADVCLKENRPVIMAPRETPLNQIHLENLLKLSRLGIKIVPPMPAFYNKPKTIDDLIHHHTMKLLDQINIHIEGKRYEGMK